MRRHIFCGRTDTHDDSRGPMQVAAQPGSAAFALSGSVCVPVQDDPASSFQVVSGAAGDPVMGSRFNQA